ncbi:putative GMP synthase [Daphnia magna]|uniref:Putative GMP synthase n=1 Tax=Daphnia magna TaxID=35525 RepID=A0A165A0W8_9CRUS|nr:putative GMP synthase [Daphnia magna]
MTGLPAIPDTHLPQEVVDKMVEAVLTVSEINKVKTQRCSSLFRGMD